jgi:hypothetical protein
MFVPMAAVPCVMRPEAMRTAQVMARESVAVETGDDAKPSRMAER